MTRGMGGHSPSNVTHNLRGLDFPAGKQDVLNCARQNRAPKEVMDVVKNLPDGEYHTMADVMKGMGNR